MSRRKRIPGQLSLFQAPSAASMPSVPETSAPAEPTVPDVVPSSWGTIPQPEYFRDGRFWLPPGIKREGASKHWYCVCHPDGSYRDAVAILYVTYDRDEHASVVLDCPALGRRWEEHGNWIQDVLSPSMGWRTGVSVEPMLGPVDIGPYLRPGGPRCQYIDNEDGCCTHPDGMTPECHSGADCPNRNRENLDWVVAGGESGPNARPMHPDWARELRDQCSAAGVPFFFKQQGEWAFGGGHATHALTGGGTLRALARGDDALGDWPCLRVGKHSAGRLLDGVEHNAYPELAYGYEVVA